MSDSNRLSDNIGFSTGALEKGDYRKAIDWLHGESIDSVELSALRFEELEPMVHDLESLSVDRFNYVSFHAPSSFSNESEAHVVDLLGHVYDRGWNIVVHPDVIYQPSLWKRFGKQLLIENMDRRKATGRTVEELETLFEEFPHARLCLDVAHARQMDTTLSLLGRIFRRFIGRIAEIHISELDSNCRHQPMSMNAVHDFQYFSRNLDKEIPVTIESTLVGPRTSLRIEEFKLAKQATRFKYHYEDSVAEDKPGDNE